MTILGFTFKENVPDLRNTKVIDVIRELDDYGINVQVHDPHADSDEAKQEYGFRLSEFDAMEPAQAVVLAVPHQEYLEQGWKLITDILDGGIGAVLDVKAKLPRDAIPEGIIHWRL